MNATKAILAIFLSAIVFAAVGLAVGYGIAALMPGYYRAVFEGGRDPRFNPIEVGVGLGLTQGMVLGVVVGALVVAGSWWKEIKLAQLGVRPPADIP